MEKEVLLKRLKEIEHAIFKQNHHINEGLKNVATLEGAKSECLHWLNEMVEKEDANKDAKGATNEELAPSSDAA